MYGYACRFEQGSGYAVLFKTEAYRNRGGMVKRGKKLAVVCTGHPYLYILAKEEKNSLTVGLWNFFADEIEGAEVKFGKAHSKAEWIKGYGKLDSDKLTAEKVPPFGFVGFTVKYGM